MKGIAGGETMQITVNKTKRLSIIENLLILYRRIPNSLFRLRISHNTGAKPTYPNMNKIIITTTNTIEGAHISEYLGILTTNLVIGTNVFSDFVASFSDFFGGMSGTYRRQLETLYDAAINNLSVKASQKNADAIIGVHIDFDEISGKGKSMFMVSIVGTAVKLKINSLNDVLEQGAQKGIHASILRLEHFKHQWSQKGNLAITKADWEFILENDIPECADKIFADYVEAISSAFQYDWVTDCLKNAPIYFSRLTYERLCDIIYKDFRSHVGISNDLIIQNKLFNAEKILELLKTGPIEDILPLLDSEKVNYTINDLNKIKEIVELLDNLPDRGAIEEVKGGFMSSTIKKKYICPEGHKNDIENEYCLTCGQNIKGLTEMQMQTIKNFKERAEILEQLLYENN